MLAISNFQLNTNTVQVEDKVDNNCSLAQKFLKKRKLEESNISSKKLTWI